MSRCLVCKTDIQIKRNPTKEILKLFIRQTDLQKRPQKRPQKKPQETFKRDPDKQTKETSRKIQKRP